MGREADMRGQDGVHLPHPAPLPTHPAHLQYAAYGRPALATGRQGQAGAKGTGHTGAGEGVWGVPLSRYCQKIWRTGVLLCLPNQPIPPPHTESPPACKGGRA